MPIQRSVLLLLLVASLAAAEEHRPAAVVADDLVRLGPGGIALPWLVMGSLRAGWTPARSGAADHGLSWGAAARWSDPDALAALRAAPAAPGGPLEGLTDGGQAVVVLALPVADDDVLGVVHVARDGADLAIDVDRFSRAGPDDAPTAVRLLVVELGELAEPTRRLRVAERAHLAYAPLPGAFVPTMLTTWTADFRPAGSPPDPVVPWTRRSLGGGGDGEPPLSAPPRRVARSLTPEPPGSGPGGRPGVFVRAVGAYDLAAWPLAAEGAPPPGPTVAALIEGPTLDSGMELRVDAIQRDGARWLVRTSQWRDDGPRRKNLPYRPLLAVPLPLTEPPARDAVVVVNRLFTAAAPGGWYREIPPPGARPPRVVRPAKPGPAPGVNEF